MDSAQIYSNLQQQQSSQIYPTMPSYDQPQKSDANKNVPNPQSTPSQNAFFSPQTAFYTPSSLSSPQQTMPSNQTVPGMEFLSNNPLLNVGYNIFGQSMKDITGNTLNMVPVQMKKSLLSIKHYFAVDQTYVMKKLCLLLFPFVSRNWSLVYSSDQPAPPRIDTNAPDYYIPLMSAITYVLITGLLLGTQNRFTPEQLGTHASSVLVYNIIEICILSLISYILNIQSKLHTLDLIAYCGYKYFGMIIALFLYLIMQSLFIYRCALFYVSISLSYFLIKCLRLQILPDTSGSQSYNPNGNTRRIYLLLLIVCIQPLFMWYLTQHLIVM